MSSFDLSEECTNMKSSISKTGEFFHKIYELTSFLSNMLSGTMSDVGKGQIYWGTDYFIQTLGSPSLITLEQINYSLFRFAPLNQIISSFSGELNKMGQLHALMNFTEDNPQQAVFIIAENVLNNLQGIAQQGSKYVTTFSSEMNAILSVLKTLSEQFESASDQNSNSQNSFKGMIAQSLATDLSTNLCESSTNSDKRKKYLENLSKINLLNLNPRNSVKSRYQSILSQWDESILPEWTTIQTKCQAFLDRLKQEQGSKKCQLIEILDIAGAIEAWDQLVQFSNEQFIGMYPGRP